MILASIKSSLFFLTLPISDAKLKIILLPPFSTCASFSIVHKLLLYQIPWKFLQ